MFSWFVAGCVFTAICGLAFPGPYEYDVSVCRLNIVRLTGVSAVICFFNGVMPTC